MTQVSNTPQGILPARIIAEYCEKGFIEPGRKRIHRCAKLEQFPVAHQAAAIDQLQRHPQAKVLALRRAHTDPGRKLRGRVGLVRAVIGDAAAVHRDGGSSMVGLTLGYLP